MPSPLALIAGPTASGKSALALALAERTGGVIVNADSAQVYRDLPILSAAPTAAEQAQVEHRLFGFLDGSAACSAADWAEQAKREIREVQASRRLPILVGGTGLYVRTLLDGIAPVPPIDPKVREQVRSAMLEANWQALQALDPVAAAKLAAGDSARIARALEVVRSTGRPLAHWQQQRAGGIASEVVLRPLILLPPRDWLYRRCDRRFAAMMAEGAIDEVRALLERRLPPSLPVMRAIGVREIARYVAGEIDFGQALELGRQATRRYAKRQYTWFAHQPPEDWPRFRDPVEDHVVEDALALLGAPV